MKTTSLDEKCVIGTRIIHLPATTSTSDEIEKLAGGGVAEGSVVWADEQTRGRGRMGRAWCAPCGKDLLFSILLRPQWSPEKMTRLTVLAAVAVARVVAALPRSAATSTIKWPNDVLIDGKKVAGILVEQKKDFAILGIGLNVNSVARGFRPELRKIATSLRITTGKQWDRETLLRELLAELDVQYARAQNDFSAVANEWAQLCGTLGKFVVVNVGNRRIEGTAHRLDDDGALIVRTESGRQERIVGGDIVLEKRHE